MAQKPEEELLETMRKHIGVRSYESIDIVEVDLAYKYISDSLSAGGRAFDRAQFSDAEFDDILLQLSSYKKTVVIKKQVRTG